MSIEHDDFTDEEARQLARDVSAKLPESLRSGLCYGRAEIRKEFSKNYVGDYTPSEDYVRLAGDKSRFLSTFVHELGHRWMYKIASPRQIAAFKNAFDNAKGRQLSLRPGDVIEFRDRAERYEFVQIGSSIEVIDLADRTMHFFTKKSVRAIKSINGENVVKYAFPSRYSQRNIREFIAVCFQFFCMGFSMDENLRSLVGRILENGQ